MRVMVRKHGQTQVLEVVDTGRPASGFASGLNGWEQERDQNAYDRYDNQQLDKRECAAFSFARYRQLNRMKLA
jgi:hypothetical protein